jgi:hypothetical protein
MTTYTIKLEVRLDDDGYLLKSPWIYEAIQEQLQDGEMILEYDVTSEENEDEAEAQRIDDASWRA